MEATIHITKDISLAVVLKIIDVTDPSNPIEVGVLDTDSYADTVAVSGIYADVAYDIQPVW